MFDQPTKEEISLLTCIFIIRKQKLQNNKEQVVKQKSTSVYIEYKPPKTQL